MSAEVTGTWQVMDRVAAVIAIVSTVGGILFAALNAHHVTRIAKDKEDLIVLIACAAFGGLVVAISGAVIRSDPWRADRGRAGTRLLWLGAVLLAAAVLGLLLL
jgi:hypothetical protein